MKTVQLMKVEAELKAPVAIARLVHFNFDEPPDNLFRNESCYNLDLCLTPRPRNARARYPEHWSSDDFQRLGSAFLVPPGEVMQVKGDEGCSQSSLLCQLQPEAMNNWFGDELLWTEKNLQAGLDIRDANIHSLLMRLAQEAKQPGFASEMLVELITAQLGIELARYCNQSEQFTTQGGLSIWRLRRIDERLAEVCEAPTLDELAQLCNLSVRQLTRGFRASRGCSIGDYVANSRVEHAKQMLATEHSVKAVAYTLGFSSPSSFCYAFRRATGETPGQYRLRLKKLH